MIEFLKQPYKDQDIIKILNPIVKEWFFNTFKEFSLPQLYGVMEIHKQNNILISAPSGGTKTLTAFLSIINELVNLAEKDQLENKIYCVYISPLKALNNDIFRNLEQPLKEIIEIAKKKNKEIKIKVAVRTGDTTAAEKQKMLRDVPHILITTPESLSIILTSIKFKEHLKYVKYVIVDEIHSLAENKRGVQLSLNLERLQNLSNFNITRIGLSATIAPLENIAEFLVGLNNEKIRNCKIADVRFPKKIDLKVLCPVKDLINTNQEEIETNLYNLLDDLIQQHRTTLIFTNTRSGTERVVHHLKEKFPKNYTENIGAHHGSLSKTHRLDIENRLKKGELKVCVTSTSLELGIDIGYIDLVILISSPKSIARGLQRFARSGHKLYDAVKGKVIVLDRDDLVECAVLIKNSVERNIDKIHIPENCLDVLSQEIIGIAISDRIHIDDLLKLIKQSYCFRNLDKEDFLLVIDYLSGKYVSLEERYIYAKIWYDEETGFIGKKGKLTRVIYMTNIGTIPDETFVLVKIGNEVVGKIDENFLERLTPSDIFVLGGQVYKYKFSRGMVAQVEASPQRPPTVPSWFSEMLPLNFDLALEIQKFRKYMEEKFKKNLSKKEILDFINNYLYVEDNAANSIYEYFKEQYLYAKIPNENKILVEFYYDEYLDKKYVIFHSLYGRRVNNVLSRAIAFIIAKLQHIDVEISVTDNGFYLSSNKKIQVLRAFKLLKSENLRKILEQSIEDGEILKRRFRHCAARSLMILREYKGNKRRVGRQQVSSMILMSAVKRISNNFPILKEARREVLEDFMDIRNAELVLKDIEKNKIKIEEISTEIPSPFAFNLILEGYTDIMKIDDKIEFVKRMHNKVLAKISLKK